MKPEEAIIAIELIREMKVNVPITQVDITNTEWAKEMATEALEKQMPKKPINDKCENCGEDVRNWTGDDNFKYCPNCGKRIDWGNEE